MKIILRNPKREVELSGRRRVKELLVELDILAGTVLVIRGDELLTSDSVVGDGDVVEVRPVMSGGSAPIIPRISRSHPVKCRKCGGGAALELRRHNAAFCREHFIEFFRKQVAEAVHKHRMFTRDETVMVAVSGGKDSLALWDVLLEEGYRTAGLYLDLGIFEYSVESKAKCEAFAAARGQTLHIERVADAVGAGIPQVQKVTRRPTCSACGLSKRYLMNKAALDHGYPVVATGHNLDDEAATLFGSVLTWQTDALPRQSPALASTHPKLVRRVKPLYRLSELETAGYAFLRGIDYIVEECPFANGRDLDRPQGASEPARGNVAGLQAQLPLRLSRKGAPGVRARGARRAPGVHVLRPGHDGDALRVLQARRAGQRPRLGSSIHTEVTRWHTR